MPLSAMSATTARRKLGVFINTVIPWAMPVVEFVYIRFIRKHWVSVYQSVWKIVPVRSEVLGPPKGVVLKTKAWLRADAARGRILSGGEGDGDERSSGASEAGAESRKRGPSGKPDLLVVELNEARICGKNGAIIGRDDRLLGELTARDPWFDCTQHEVLLRLRLPSVAVAEKRVACVYTHPALASNYGHWLFECVSKFAYFREAYGWDAFDRIVINRITHPFQEESLSLAGIPRDRAIELGPQLHLKAASMVVSAYTAYATEQTPRWVCDAVRRVIGGGAHGKEPYRRIYLSRRHVNRRKVVNEDEVAAILERRGVEVVIPERLSLSEQAALFGESTHVIGLYGAALCNLVFCRPGGKLLEFRVNLVPNRAYYEDLARTCGLEYRHIEATPVNRKWGQNAYYPDVRIDPGELEKALEAMGL